MIDLSELADGPGSHSHRDSGEWDDEHSGAPGSLDMLTRLHPAWQREAACRGMDPGIFFPEDYHAQAAVVEICAGCPVRETCLEFALDNRILYGTWGGASQRQRTRMLRQRRQAS